MRRTALQRPLFRLAWMFTALTLVLSAVFSTANVRGAATDVIPRVVDLTPVGGEELPVTGSVTFYFNTPMDRASVEAALVVQPATDGRQTVTGVFAWQDDRTATFKPATALNRAVDYLFSFKSGARSQAGLALNAGASFRVRTVGTLDVTQIIPATGSKDVDADALITVIFNRPVVPVVPISEEDKLPNPLIITPAVTGKGRWINTSTYQFKPEKPLNGGATYVVTVKKGLTDVSGAQLSADISSAFLTVAPRVIEIIPEDRASFITREQVITVAFSQPMDRAATEAGFALTGPGGKKTAGEYTWREDNRSFTFKPSALLDYGALYDVTLDKETVRATSGGQISAGAKASFTVNGLPQITKVTPENGKTTQSTVFRLSFNQPMKLDNFEQNISIDPKPAKVDYSFEEYDQQHFQAVLAVENNTTYTITINPKGVTDKYGTPLTVQPNSPYYTVLPDGRLQVRFTVRLQYAPQASLQTGGPVGLYSAYAPTTRVYSTHRNVSELNLELYKLSTDDVRPFLSSYVYDDLRKYQPPDTQFVRGWRVPLENPPQVLRYDLLDISANGPGQPRTASFECAGAPVTRLRVGQTGFVLRTPPSPSNLRAQPGRAANIIARMPPGTSFPVQNGPRCVEGIIWYQTIYNGLTGWFAEGQGNQYFTGPTEDAGNAPAPAAPIPPARPGTGKEPLAPGVYLLKVGSPQLRADAEPLKHVMIVATANLSLKMHGTGAQVWITDLKTGLPIPNTPVKFYTRVAEFGTDGFKQGAFVDAGTATTDANGIAVIRYPLIQNLYNAQLTAVVDDGKTFAIGSNYLSTGIEAYNYNLETTFEETDSTVYLYSDRSLYKPGQPVYFKGVLRSKNDVTYGLYTANAGKPIQIEITNDNGEKVYEVNAPLTPFGTFSGRFLLDSGAALGSYQIVAKLEEPGKLDDKGQPVYRTYARQISVAEYRAPEFRVDLTSPEAVVQGETIKIAVSSSFFFGGALPNTPVEWSAQASDYYFQYEGQGGYNFTDFNDDAGPGDDFTNGFGNQIASGKGKTDAGGLFSFELPADLGKNKTSKTYVIEATVTDTTGQAVSARALLTVHAGQFYIGAAPREYVADAGKQTTIDLITVGWDSQPTPNTDLNVRAVEREWRSVKQVNPESGKTVWTYEVKETPIESAGVKTDADGKAQFVFTPPRAGVYKIYATSRDAKGNQISTATYVYAAGPEYVPWRQQNSYAIDLKTDKTTYQIGDTASILIASPFQGAAKAWITVERGGILKSEVIDLPTNSTVYKLPIEAGLAPNAFISVLIVKGTDDKNPIAAFRLGYAGISVNADRYKLNISATPDKDKAGPREDVTYTLKVTDYAGKPVQAEIGVSLSDLAVLSLLPDNSTPISQHFYNRQGLSVRTASLLTISVDEQTQSILNTVKGGGGGGRESGVLEIRQLFVDTPLWAPTVTTDANGEAKVTVTLPDQLTTWRLDVRAVTLPTGELNTTLVGQMTSDLLSTKPLIVRPLTPRFFIAGDKADLAATVNNNTGAEQEVTIALALKGGTLSGPDKFTVKIADRASASVSFPMTVDVGAQNIEAVFSAVSADQKFTDAAKPQVGKLGALPVYRYEAPETVSTSGVITNEGGDRLEGIVLPTKLNITQGQLDLRIDPSLSVTAVDALTALNGQPFDCTEAVSSRLFANSATARAFGTLKLAETKVKTDLDEAVNIALQNLYSLQHVDGGYGWCYLDYSSAHVTAYALLALTEAKNAGYTVEQNVIDRAVSYLNNNLAALNDQATPYLLNRQAFALYTLAKAGAGNVSRTVGLFAIRERLNIYARALLLSTFNTLTPDDKARINALISDLQNTAITSASGQHWEERIPDRFNWNTNTRTTSMVLMALTEVQPTSPLLPNIVRWLMYNRQSDRWETYHETAWAVRALTNWLVISGDLNPAYSFSASINEKPLVANTDTAATAQAVRTATTARVSVAELLKGDVNRLFLTRTPGTGTLYYTANLSAYLPVDQIQPASRGLTITRAYSLANDKTHQPITAAQVGQNVRVTLTIIVPEDMPNVVVTDPIPAGTEALNPDLVTTGVGVQPELRLNDPFEDGYGWWWFGDTQLRDEKTILSAEYLPRGTYTYTYVVRAGLAGTYNVIPSTAQQVYFPDVYGRSNGAVFTITK